MVHPDNVRDSLKVLPETLTDAYGEIHNRIRKQSGRTSQLALNALRWVQCSYEPLRSETLLDAVTVGIGGSGEFSRNCTAVGPTDLLKACQNLLILDERLNVFRFAHLSVEEYMETQQLKVDSHTEIAKVCLSLVCTSSVWGDYNEEETAEPTQYKNRHLLSYAATFWPWHLSHDRYENSQTLTVLWDRFVSGPTYQHWLEYHPTGINRWRDIGSDSFWRRWRALQEGPQDLLTCVCVFGLAPELGKVLKSQPETLLDRLLFFPCRFGDLEVARLLIDRGVDLSPVDGYGMTPLNTALRHGHEASAQLLIERGANLSTADWLGMTPLHIALREGHQASAQLLIEWGADLSTADEGGQTPLHAALRHGHEAAAQLLIERGVDFSAADELGVTPLHTTLRHGYEASALLLIERGANLSAVDGDGMTPLHIALQWGHVALAQLLIERGADLSAADEDGQTPLHTALRHGHEAAARLLIERGADFSVADGLGMTPLHIALRHRFEASAQLLIERGVHLSTVDWDGMTPLRIALQRGHVALAQLLIEQGAGLSAVGGLGKTPVHIAFRPRNKALAQLLVERGDELPAVE